MAIIALYIQLSALVNSSIVSKIGLNTINGYSNYLRGSGIDFGAFGKNLNACVERIKDYDAMAKEYEQFKERVQDTANRCFNGGRSENSCFTDAKCHVEEDNLPSLPLPPTECMRTCSRSIEPSFTNFGATSKATYVCKGLLPGTEYQVGLASGLIFFATPCSKHSGGYHAIWAEAGFAGQSAPFVGKDENGLKTMDPPPPPLILRVPDDGILTVDFNMKNYGAGEGCRYSARGIVEVTPTGH